MTQEQKQIKLAEAAGWRLFSPFKNLWAPPKHVVEYECDAYPLPDYFNDLNAVHELEQQTWFKEWNLRDDFCDHLALIIDPLHGYRGLTVSDALQATATQRAEALGLTLNLW
jgi:hypothetical protein